MLSSPSQDHCTEAKIVIVGQHAHGQSSSPQTLIDTVGFTYSSDPTILGDPFTVAVPNPFGIYTNQLQVGSKVELYLQNPNVDSGQLALKQTGIVVRRRASSTSQGSTIFLECADLGWHLLNNDAPLFAPLRGGTAIEDLLKQPGWLDPAWGISYDPTYDNKTNRDTKLDNGRAAKIMNLSPSPFTPLQRIQVEPGDKISDLLTKYARRKNSFFNVNVKGHIEFWNPEENQTPRYRIEYHPVGTTDSVRNNVLEATLEEDIHTFWTQVTCVGEKIVTELMGTDPTDINGTKVKGIYPGPKQNQRELPFSHRFVFSDGEISEENDAWRLAKWKYQRGQYDSFKLIYLVKNHHQSHQWWEADTLCDVRDDVHGIHGTFYVGSVTYTRDEQGDRTQVVLRKRGLLQAYLNPTDTPPSTKKRYSSRRRKTSMQPI